MIAAVCIITVAIVLICLVAIVAVSCCILSSRISRERGE